MTLAEIIEQGEAFAQEEKRQLEQDCYRTAWLASNIMNASGNLKTPVTPEKLLGNAFKQDKPEKRMTREEQAEALNDLKRKFGYNE